MLLWLFLEQEVFFICCVLRIYYMTVVLPYSFPAFLSYSVCIPKQCKEDDHHNISKQVLCISAMPEAGFFIPTGSGSQVQGSKLPESLLLWDLDECREGQKPRSLLRGF